MKEYPREKVQIATKFGITVTGDFQFGSKGTPEYVRECCEASLKALDVDYIDLYYQHRVDTTVPIEDTVSRQRTFYHVNMIQYLGMCFHLMGWFPLVM